MKMIKRKILILFSLGLGKFLMKSRWMSLFVGFVYVKKNLETPSYPHANASALSSTSISSASENGLKERSIRKKRNM